MQPVPFDRQVIEDIRTQLKIDIGNASIREMNALVNTIEQRFDTNFIRMEFGIPGIPADQRISDAEAEAMDRGVANTYAPFQGIPELKQAASNFIKAFVDLDVSPAGIIPTIGAMQGSLLAMGLAGFQDKNRDTILFLDPGFPVNKQQTRFWGLKSISLDLKDFRGDALISRVDELCGNHPISGCMWSSPNNPSWVVLTEAELKGLAAVFDKHRVMAIEDFAYFGMDFRQDYSKPYEPPFQPTIARYTHRVFMIISSSKLFSYAGQRCGLTVIPDAFAEEEFPDLEERFTKTSILGAFIHGGIYPTTSSIPQSPQWGLAALLNATVAGTYSPWISVDTYRERASFMKKAFLDHGFHLVYDDDLGDPLSDGFYFTVGYPGMTSAELSRNIVPYGISAITLDTTGSLYHGLRACTSLIQENQYDELIFRLQRFQEDHPTN